MNALLLETDVTKLRLRRCLKKKSYCLVNSEFDNMVSLLYRKNELGSISSVFVVEHGYC